MRGTWTTILKQYDITGIQGVDTRALTRILRSQGTMNGMITCAEHFYMEELPGEDPGLPGGGHGGAGDPRRSRRSIPPWSRQKLRVALMDFGVKQNMIRCLQKRGCEVTVFPAHTPARDHPGRRL